MKLKQITVRVSEEIAGLFQRTFETTKLPKKEEFILQLLNTFNDPNKAILAETEKNTRLSQTVINLQNENAKLKSENSILIPEVKQHKITIIDLQNQLSKVNEEAPGLQRTNQALTAEIETLQNQVTELENNPQTEIKDKTLAPNQVIITIPESIKYFLDIVTKAESERVKKEITDEIILLQLFWKQITDGKGYYLPVTFTNTQIRNILNQIKETKEQQAHEQTSD